MIRRRTGACFFLILALNLFYQIKIFLYDDNRLIICLFERLKDLVYLAQFFPTVDFQKINADAVNFWLTL